MGEKRAYKSRKPGGGRKKLKPEYDAGKNLKEQMESAVVLYDSEMSLQSIGDELGLNPIKVRKLLITAGVYESEVAEKVKNTFEEYRETQDYKTSILSTANILQLSKASVTSYLPYKKGVYFPSTAEKEKISVGAERQRRYRAMKRWRVDPTEENFWGVVLAYAGIQFKTYSGLPFSYQIKKGRNGEYTESRKRNTCELASAFCSPCRSILPCRQVRQVTNIYVLSFCVSSLSSFCILSNSSISVLLAGRTAFLLSCATAPQSGHRSGSFSAEKQ